MEFHSLLKELGPSEDARQRDYRVIQNAEELKAWMAAIPEGAPVAVAISPSAEGEFSLDTVGLAWRPGEARAVTAENLAHLKPYLECAALPKIACDVKSALLMLDRMGIQARGFDHDVMLYAFLLDADPSGCPLDEQARRRMDLKLGASPEQHADITLELCQQLSPAVDGRDLRELYTTIELPLAGVLARMERTGIRIDPVELKRLSGMMEGEIARLTGEMHATGGQAFQHQLAAAVGQSAVRGSEAARAGEIRQREDYLDRGGRAGRTGGRITKLSARCWSTGN